MLLIPTIQQEGNLLLDAYSYDHTEIASVENSLHKCDIQFSVEQLPNDQHDRVGRRHNIIQKYITRIENYFGIIFVGTGDNTAIKRTKNTGGKQYRCQEISLHGSGSSCIELLSNNDDDARLTCSLLAGNNGWFGGVASQGNCSKL